MGITISSKDNSCDMGCGGFFRFRTMVAKCVSDEIGDHYNDLTNAPFYTGADEFFREHDLKTNQFISDGKLPKLIAKFLYQSDVSGKISRKQAELIYELIKNENDEIIYGYAGRSDCATMKDLKLIFSDDTSVKWS